MLPTSHRRHSITHLKPKDTDQLHRWAQSYYRQATEMLGCILFQGEKSELTVWMVCLNMWPDTGTTTKVYRGHGIFKSFFFPAPNQIICNRPSAGPSQPWLIELTFWKLASGEQGAGSPVWGSKEMPALNFRLNQCYSQPGSEAKSFTQSGLVTQRGRKQNSLRFPSVKRKLSLVYLKRS